MTVQPSDDDVSVTVERLQHATQQNPDDPGLAFELAIALRARFERTGDGQALDEAIRLADHTASRVPAADPEQAAVLSFWAAALRARFEYAGNAEDLSAAVSTARSALAAASPTPALRPAVLSGLAAILAARSEHTGQLSDLDEAIMVIRQALDAMPPGAPDRPAVLSNLATALRARADRRGDTRDLDEAVTAARAALASVDPDDPLRATAQSTLARVLHLKGHLDEAAAELRAVLDLRRRSLGSDHPDTLATRHLLAVVLRDDGRADAAEPELREVLDARRRILGADHPDTLATRHMLAVVLRDQGFLAEAAAECRAVLYEARRVLGNDHPDTTATQRLLEAVDDEARRRPHDLRRHVHPAERDPLTGLLHRVAFVDRSDREIRATSAEVSGALILLDLDGFRELNAAFGYAAGDVVLRAVADQLVQVARRDELTARLGNDEFAVFLPARRQPDADTPLAPRISERARVFADALARPVEVQGMQVSVTASMGLVQASSDIDTGELLRRADMAMNQARRDGPGTVAWWNGRDGSTPEREQLLLVQELRHALAAPGQFEVALQPIISLETGHPVAVEALARWRHPRRGYLAPAEFVPAVEASDLAGPFTRHIVDVALSHASAWAQDGIILPVAVNVSPRALMDPRLPGDIGALLRRHRLPADQLSLEIPEPAASSNLDPLVPVVAELKRSGIRLSIDDFGTGFSSLSFLARIAVSELKIDSAFVRRMADSSEAAAMLRATIDLARHLELEVVALGVETGEQRDLLAAMGYTRAQGYFFSAPLRPRDFTRWLRQVTVKPTQTSRGGKVIHLGPREVS